MSDRITVASAEYRGHRLTVSLDEESPGHAIQIQKKDSGKSDLYRRYTGNDAGALETARALVDLELDSGERRYKHKGYSLVATGTVDGDIVVEVVDRDNTLVTVVRGTRAGNPLTDPLTRAVFIARKEVEEDIKYQGVLRQKHRADNDRSR